MREFLITMVVMVVGVFVFTTCVDIGNGRAKEPTTLDEAINRPVVIKKYVDKKNGVVCYWNARHPGDLECVRVEDLGWR